MAEVPRTRSGKVVELAVRSVAMGEVVRNREALANPEARGLYRDRPELATRGPAPVDPLQPTTKARSPAASTRPITAVRGKRGATCASSASASAGATQSSRPPLV